MRNGFILGSINFRNIVTAFVLYYVYVLLVHTYGEMSLYNSVNVCMGFPRISDDPFVT